MNTNNSLIYISLYTLLGMGLLTFFSIIILYTYSLFGILIFLSISLFIFVSHRLINKHTASDHTNSNISTNQDI